VAGLVACLLVPDLLGVAMARAAQSRGAVACQWGGTVETATMGGPFSGLIGCRPLSRVRVIHTPRRVSLACENRLKRR